MPRGLSGEGLERTASRKVARLGLIGWTYFGLKKGGAARVNRLALFRLDIGRVVILIFGHLAQELLELAAAFLAHTRLLSSASASSTVFGLAMLCLTSASRRITRASMT